VNWIDTAAVYGLGHSEEVVARALADWRGPRPYVFTKCERVWDEKREIDWMLLDFEAHRRLREYTKALNHLYLETAALWERDDSWEGFRWAVCDDSANSVVAFRRIDAHGGEILCAVNFCPVGRPDYRVPVQGPSVWQEVLSSDDTEFGGAGIRNGTVKAEPSENGDYAVALHLSPLSAVFLKKLPEEGTP
jgi:1,4-alpha-glucan branching enzyme